MRIQSTFPLGVLVATRSALEKLAESDIADGLTRHACRDWGELAPDDRQANDQALLEGTRLLSAYTSADGVRFWIITEADRSSTTVLLPDDY